MLDTKLYNSVASK